ncbi:Scr1 family TA system antitoxin-like transcriptional regulator, partial [Nocardiopsis sp. FR6]
GSRGRISSHSSSVSSNLRLIFRLYTGVKSHRSETQDPQNTPYGSPKIQREQLAHVASLVDSDRLTVQMVPTDSPRHAGNSGPRRIITTADEPEVVYMESAEEGRIITDSAGIFRSRLLFTALQGAARDPQETLQAIRDEMRKIDDE